MYLLFSIRYYIRSADLLIQSKCSYKFFLSQISLVLYSCNIQTRYVQLLTPSIFFDKWAEKYQCVKFSFGLLITLIFFEWICFNSYSRLYLLGICTKFWRTKFRNVVKEEYIDLCIMWYNYISFLRHILLHIDLNICCTITKSFGNAYCANFLRRDNEKLVINNYVIYTTMRVIAMFTKIWI